MDDGGKSVLLRRTNYYSY